MSHCLLGGLTRSTGQGVHNVTRPEFVGIGRIAESLLLDPSVCPEPLANLLLVSRELQNLTSTALPWYALAMVLETLIIILSRCLIVAGQRKRAMIWVSLGQWGLFLPLMIWCIPSYGFIMVWWLHIGYRAIVSGILWLSWQHYLQQRKTQGQAS